MRCIRTNPNFTIQREPSRIRYFMGDRIWSLDKATLTLDTESGDTYDHAYLQANGILAVEPDDFFSPNFMISKDFGHNWSNPLRGTKTDSELERRSYVGNKGHLLMLSRSQVRSGVAYYYDDAKVQYSDNLAQSWNIVGEIPGDCQDLLHEISNDDAVYLYCQEGDLMLSRDFGQNWEPVYQYQQPDLNEPRGLRT